MKLTNQQIIGRNTAGPGTIKTMLQFIILTSGQNAFTRRINSKEQVQT